MPGLLLTCCPTPLLVRAGCKGAQTRPLATAHALALSPQRSLRSASRAGIPHRPACSGLATPAPQHAPGAAVSPQAQPPSASGHVPAAAAGREVTPASGSAIERVLRRKPLTAAEEAEPPTTVCVTGATGYIASQIICRLLAAGHTVHATHRGRGGGGSGMEAALRSVPGAAERLKWFAADLSKEGSFDEAVSGCKYVIHTAAPVDLHSPRSKTWQVVNPCIKGALNVLGSVSRAQSVERVVFTSSYVAVMGGPRHGVPGYVATEADWNISFGIHAVPYFIAKTVSEWEAWALAAQQGRWRLVTVCPANVVGPPLLPTHGEAVDTAVKLMNGSTWPFAPPVDLPTVDVADVAAAHVLGAITPAASGRYIVCERCLLLNEITTIIRRIFPGRWVPYIPIPFWLTVFLFWLKGILSFSWLQEAYGRRTLLNSEKAVRELQGLGPLIPLETTLRDAGLAFMEMGMLPRKPLAGGGAVEEAAVAGSVAGLAAGEKAVEGPK